MTERPCSECGRCVVGLWPAGRCYSCHIKAREGRNRVEHNHDCYDNAEKQEATREDR